MSAPAFRQPGRAERLAEILERDGPTCVWCARPFTSLIVPTTEHLVPRVKGGPSWDVNEVAACRRCNHERGHVALAAWAEECRRRGWDPDVDRIVAILSALDEAVRTRGGQRRARPYVAAQLRRLRRL